MNPSYPIEAYESLFDKSGICIWQSKSVDEIVEILVQVVEGTYVKAAKRKEECAIALRTYEDLPFRTRAWKKLMGEHPPQIPLELRRSDIVMVIVERCCTFADENHKKRIRGRESFLVHKPRLVANILERHALKADAT